MNNDDVMKIHQHLMPNDQCHNLMGQMMPKGKFIASNVNTDKINMDAPDGTPQGPDQFPYDQHYDMRNSDTQTKINTNFM